MRWFDRIRKAFDTGGIAVELEAPEEFGWRDRTIPVRVTLTGHGSRTHSIQQLSFSLSDGGDHQPVPGNGASARVHRRTGRRFSATYVHLLALELRPGATQTLEVDIPLATPRGPGLVNRRSFVREEPDPGTPSAGTAQNPGAQWYVLSVSAPVTGTTTSRTDTARLRAASRVGDHRLQPG